MKLNGKVYIMPDLKDYNTLANFEARGVDIDIMKDFFVKAVDKPLESLRQIIALVCDLTLEEAGYELQRFVENGGKLPKLLDEIGHEAERYLELLEKEGKSRRKKKFKFYKHK